MKIAGGENGQCEIITPLGNLWSPSRINLRASLFKVYINDLAKIEKWFAKNNLTFPD